MQTNEVGIPVENKVAIGPVMLDIESDHLSELDKELLACPEVGGVILFRRNIVSAEQVFRLTQSIRAVKSELLIAVDQEGGRVQRLVDGFTRIPAMAAFGHLYLTSPELALEFCRNTGELMALEVQSVGCDLSFAPVLDLGFSTSKVIGDRAFATSVDSVIALAGAFIDGMNSAGMSATGKHFPGHGSVEADSHLSMPVDERSLDEICERDLRPFAALSAKLAGMMPAHILFPQVDSSPAGFSQRWLQKILRQQLKFQGAIFSDDLSMKGAEFAGSYKQRAESALGAGCDMLLACNNRNAAIEVIQSLKVFSCSGISQTRLSALRMPGLPAGLEKLKQSMRWQALNASLQEFKRLI